MFLEILDLFQKLYTPERRKSKVKLARKLIGASSFKWDAIKAFTYEI